MHKFMPHNFLPVCRQGVRRNQGYYLAKTDSNQWADVWKTHGAHRKVRTVLEDFNKNLAFGLKAVFCRERLPTLFEQGFQVRPEDK